MAQSEGHVPAPESDVSISPASATTSLLSQAGHPSNAQRRTSSYRNEFGVDGNNLETPADALRILCAAAKEEQTVDMPMVEYMGPQDSKMWNRWGPVRDGLLTSEEAGALLNFFARHLLPLHPVVPSALFQAEHFGALLNESVLLCAICLCASRFHDLGPSFDAVEPSRSKIVQSKLVTWFLARLGYLTMGDPAFRTIGTVEALLVLSEWPPRALLLKDPTSSRQSTAPSLPTACKLFDDLAWTLTGLALRIAQELSLHDETTYADPTMPRWMIQRRIDCWIYCLAADRHVSVRLGRVSLVQEMSTTWWEGLCNIMFVTGSGDHPMRQVSNLSWRETQAISELTHYIGLLQDVLYASPTLTADLVRTRRFEPILHRMKPELDSLSQWINPALVPGDVLKDSVPGMEQEEIREIRLRIEVDYVRLYANAISMRAAHSRLSARMQSNSQGVFDLSVLRWAEAPFLLEVVEAALSLMRCGVALHRRQVLRYCPGRTFLRMMFASVFLMKAASFGGIVQPEAEVSDLQYALIDALREAAVDEDHLAAQLASLLSRLYPPPSARIDDSTQDNHVNQNAADPLALFNFDLASGGIDMSALGDEMGIDPAELQDSLGFNPNGLVSFIEAMVAGTSGAVGDGPL